MGKFYSSLGTYNQCSFEDSRGEVWIGTKTNGLLRFLPEDGYLEPISGAPCMDIVSIEEDLHGNLWVGTEYGLGKYDRDLKLFTNYYASSGIGGNQFIERASYLLSNGTLVFGGTHGLTFSIQSMSRRNKLYLYYLKI